jgi:ATP-dependent Lon protease
MVIPLFVGRDKSILALDVAMQVGKQIVLVAQQHADVDEPDTEDLFEIGTLATILQLLKLPDGTVKVLVEGAERVALSDVSGDGYFKARMEILGEDTEDDEREVEVLVRSIVSQFESSRSWM